MEKSEGKIFTSRAPHIIVKELDHKLIEEAVNEDAEDEAYWLRVFSMSAGEVIPD